MRINLNFGYDKLHLKEIVILIPKYHNNMVSFLTPILGLYGINVKEFINEFELKTKFITFDVVVPTSVKISKIKTFEITLKTPYIIPLLSNLEDFSINKPAINILSIYKISLLKSLFLANFLTNYHKNIYISIRKYISLVVKGVFEIRVVPTILNFHESFGTKKMTLSFLKNSIGGFLNLKRLLINNFGVFVIFNNSSAKSIYYLKKTLSVYNISFNKIKSRFASSLCNSAYFKGNIFLISSPFLNFFSIFYKEIYLKTFSSNFFPIYWKFKSNLMARSFLKEVFSNFSSTTFSSNFYVLKVLFLNFSKPLRVLNYSCKSLVFLLKYHYANLSSNTP